MKTNCMECKKNIRAGFFNKPHCVETDPAEELTQWNVLFINDRGCMSFEVRP